MEFKLKCPKCGATDVDVFLDRAYGYGPREGVPAFHCRVCGKRLYGKDKVDTEIAKQQEEWRATEKHNGKPTHTPSPALPSTTRELFNIQTEAAIKTMMRDASALQRDAEGYRDDLWRVWENSPIRRGDNTPSHQMNLLEIDVNRIGYLVGKIRSLVAERLTLRTPGAIRTLLEEIQGILDALPKRVKKVQEALEEEESALRERQAAAKPEPPDPIPTPDPEEVTICEWGPCTKPALPGRKYCGDEDRKRAARQTYREKQKAKRLSESRP